MEWEPHLALYLNLGMDQICRGMAMRKLKLIWSSPSLSPDIFTSVNEPMNLQWNSSHEQAAENGSNGMCKHGNPAFAVENVTHIESTVGMCKRGSPTLLSKL